MLTYLNEGHYSGKVESLPTDQLLGPLNDIESKYAPAQLYFSGHSELLKQSPRVAIVGSRKASARGLALTNHIVANLVEEKAIIVSGLAFGIDTAAHKRAIELGGKTIAVLGTPLNVVTPRENRELQHLIMTEHLAVSQFAPGSVVKPHFFPTRNRTMALICQASVIIEAGDGSGTLSQGWEAMRLGRSLFISRDVIENEALSWPAEMLEYGAQVIDENIDPLLETLPPPGEIGQLQNAF
jgi:DNA processing protein